MAGKISLGSKDYQVSLEGLEAFSDLSEAPKKLRMNAVRATNRAAAKHRTRAAREMREQVNFPASYLTGRGGRLRITKKATSNDIESIVTGRFRPTSLANFVSGGARRILAKQGKKRRRSRIRLSVKPGRSIPTPGAFIMPLRSGNIGLAVRLKGGENLRNKSVRIPSQGNLFLLYGPSVDQVYRSVAGDDTPRIADELEAEFLRLSQVFK